MMEICVFDGHCDTILNLERTGQSLEENSCHVSLQRARRFSGYAQFFAFFTARGPVDPQTYFRRLYACFQRQLEQLQGALVVCRTGAEVESAIAQKKRAALLSIEGAEAIGCDPGRLDWAWELGIRMVSPTWNDANPLAGSHLTGEGLSRQGKEFVRRAQSLGMVVDVSHCSEQAFWDICEIAEKPIVASHSNAKACCNHSRNLTDEQYLALCQLGGTAGLNLYSRFLGQADVTMETVRQHLEHFAELGIGHLALGGDWDGCDSLPEGMAGIDGYEALYEYLQQNGWDERELSQVYFGNLMKVVKQCNM